MAAPAVRANFRSYRERLRHRLDPPNVKVQEDFWELTSACWPIDAHELERTHEQQRGRLYAIKRGRRSGGLMADVVASQVSVRDIKTHLSEWLARAQAGEVVEVTSHRKPIALLTGLKQPETTPANPLQVAIDAGIVSWNGKKPHLPPPVRRSDKGPLVSDLVIQGRV